MAITSPINKIQARKFFEKVEIPKVKIDETKVMVQEQNSYESARAQENGIIKKEIPKNKAVTRTQVSYVHFQWRPYHQGI